MNRLKLGFNRLSRTKFLALVLVIAEKLNQEPATTLLPQPWNGITWVQLKAAVDALANACAEAENGGREQRLICKLRREELTVLLVTLGLLFQSIANQTQDERVLECTGFELARAAAPGELVDVLPPTTITLRRGNQAGEMFVTAKRLEQAGSYETQTCLGDPNVEANWKQAVISTVCRRIRLAGLTPGKTYYVRLRGIGSNGPGAWSDVANLMAT